MLKQGTVDPSSKTEDISLCNTLTRVLPEKSMIAINVTRKGQITIPAHLRKKYDITENSKVEVVEENGKLVINKLVTIFDLAGTGKGDPQELKRQLDQMRETDARQDSL